MNIMSINIRGMSGCDKPGWVSKMRAANKCAFLGLQESHFVGSNQFLFDRFWGKGRFLFDAVDAVGRSGGLVSMWDPDCLSVDSVVKNHGFLPGP